MESEFEFITICGKTGNEESITNSFLHLLSINIIFRRRQTEVCVCERERDGGGVWTDIDALILHQEKFCLFFDSSRNWNLPDFYLFCSTHQTRPITEMGNLISLLFLGRFHNFILKKGRVGMNVTMSGMQGRCEDVLQSNWELSKVQDCSFEATYLPFFTPMQRNGSVTEKRGMEGNGEHILIYLWCHLLDLEEAIMHWLKDHDWPSKTILTCITVH